MFQFWVPPPLKTVRTDLSIGFQAIFNLVFHHPTPGWGGENFDFEDEQNDEDSTDGFCFCVSVLHMSKLKGAVAAGVCVRLSRSNKSPAKVGSF